MTSTHITAEGDSPSLPAPELASLAAARGSPACGHLGADSLGFPQACHVVGVGCH